jgi:hypothetical protein
MVKTPARGSFDPQEFLAKVAALRKGAPPLAAVPPSLGRRLEDSAIRRVVVYRKSHKLSQKLTWLRRPLLTHCAYSSMSDTYSYTLIVLPIALASFRTSFSGPDGGLPFSVTAAIGPAMSPSSTGAFNAASPAGMVIMELLSAVTKCPVCSGSSRNWIERVVTGALGIASLRLGGFLSTIGRGTSQAGRLPSALPTDHEG